ncbi:hypothetical protein BH18ACT6_BH18ACT6_14330 [soil metagenome]
MLWVHFATALLIIPLAIWHVWARKMTPRAVDVSRRNLIRLGGLASAAALLWWSGDRAIALAQLPGAKRRFSGSHERSSFVPEGVPLTSWLDDRTPSLDASSWQVDIDDSSGRRSLTLSELTAMENETITAELDCTSGWFSREPQAAEIGERGETVAGRERLLSDSSHASSGAGSVSIS